MIEISPFDLHDLEQMEVQQKHKELVPVLFNSYLSARRMLEGPWAWTAWTEHGRPVASCGILNNGGAWAFLSEDLRRDMVAVTRAVRRVLELHAAVKGPVFADIDGSFAEGVRWAKFLGFQPGAEDPSRWWYDA
jgi:hypothetical protein